MENYININFYTATGHIPPTHSQVASANNLNIVSKILTSSLEVETRPKTAIFLDLETDNLNYRIKTEKREELYKEHELCFLIRESARGFRLWQTKPSTFQRYAAGIASLEEIYSTIKATTEKFEIYQSQYFKEFLSKSIEFSPEHKQAGLQILNYFQETLSQKYPDDDVTVRIGQKGNLVTMEIETPDGNTEKFEEALEDYGLVVTGKKDVAEYLEDKVDQMSLKHQLHLAKVQLEHKTEMLQLKSENLVTKDQIIRSQEQGLQYFMNELSLAFTTIRSNAESLPELAKLAMASDSGLNYTVAHLEQLIKEGKTEEAQEELKTMEKAQPGLGKRMLNWTGGIFRKAGEKALTGELTKVVQSVIESVGG